MHSISLRILSRTKRWLGFSRWTAARCRGRCCRGFVTCLVAATVLIASAVAGDDPPTAISVKLRRQIPQNVGTDRYLPELESQAWAADRVAVIICDVWDAHHCLNAVRRVTELAPRIDAFANRMREQGATIIHAPSDCMPQYEEHPCRVRSKETMHPNKAPETIRSWCNAIESESGLPYPVDQSDGGEDDEMMEHGQWHATLASMGRDPKRPWLRQTPAIGIDADRDYISDSGTEIWSILKERGIEHVLLCGVHTNMCVLGRPFGLRQLTAHGFHAVLVRDLTDTMYNPKRWPYVNHFTGTDLVIDHIERSVCQTITSDQVLGGKPFRFSTDRRPRWVIMISEDEYRTEETLFEWARIHLAKDCEVRFVFEDPRVSGRFPGAEALESADGLLLSVRRRPLKSETMNILRSYIARGGAVLGIRTSSHGFCLRENAPSPGLEQWPEFDAEVFGGSYTGHHRDDVIAHVESVDESVLPRFAKIVATQRKDGDAVMQSKGSLYRVLPLHPAARVLWKGTIPEQPSQPIAWSFVRADSGKSFYTSLGHRSDFEQPLFRALLLHAAHALTGGDLTLGDSDITLEAIEGDRLAYRSGQGKQR
jgi:nicotinamidase-related amidase